MWESVPTNKVSVAILSRSNHRLTGLLGCRHRKSFFIVIKNIGRVVVHVKPMAIRRLKGRTDMRANVVFSPLDMFINAFSCWRLASVLSTICQ